MFIKANSAYSFGSYYMGLIKLKRFKKNKKINTYLETFIVTKYTKIYRNS